MFALSVAFFVIFFIHSVSSNNSGLSNVCSEEDGTCKKMQSNVEMNNKPKIKIAKGSNENGAPPEVLIECVDRYPAQCPGYAQRGECEINPGWMIINCGKSCDACHLRDPKLRCDRNFLNISTEPVLYPGDLDALFKDIMPRFGSIYDVEVLSTSPWVVLFNNFLTDEESNAFIETSEGNWERSTDTGNANAFGETGRTLSRTRTSSNAWCRQACEDNPHVQNVITKIEEVTGISYDNSESFQILQYEVGQFYRVHHDMAPRQNSLSCGPRILTFFLYLSDVEEGGETNFPNIGIKVKPRKGSAVLWPSVLNDDPTQQDTRTHHEALPVIKGVKYASNSWIHLYDFQKSNLWGCTGTFDYLDV